MSAEDIVVTGIGMVSPVSPDTDSTMKALSQGESGVQVLLEDAPAPRAWPHAPLDRPARWRR